MVQVPIFTSETLKLAAVTPVAPKSWLIALERSGKVDPPTTPSADHSVTLCQLPLLSETGFRIARNNESPVVFPLRKAVVEDPLMGITLVALQPVLTSQRWILSALTAPEKTLQSANVRAPVRIFLFMVSPVFELTLDATGLNCFELIYVTALTVLSKDTI